MQRNWHFRRRFVAVRGPTDVTAPVLSAPVALPLGDTTGYLAAITNEANGTLYWVLTTSATPPSAAQVKAGQDHTGAAAAAAGNQAVTTTGYQLITATGLTSNTAYYAYFMQQDAIGNQSAVLASSTFTTLTTGTSDTSFDNLIAAMVVPPNNFRKANIAQLIQKLYAGGVWAKTDAMWVFAAHDEQAARLNWITPGTYTCTAVNSPTFVTDRSFAGNGSSSYLDTNFAPNTNAVQLTQNSAHYSLYLRTAQNGNEPFSVNNAGFRNSVNAGTGTTARGRINSGTEVQAPAGGTLPNQAIGRRTDATNVSIMRDGVQVTAPTAAASAAFVSGNMRFGVRGSGTFLTSQMAGGALGGYLDDTESLAHYTAWNAYMVAVGADT